MDEFKELETVLMLRWQLLFGIFTHSLCDLREMKSKANKCEIAYVSSKDKQVLIRYFN